jgi:hypothetical protein
VEEGRGGISGAGRTGEEGAAGCSCAGGVLCAAGALGSETDRVAVLRIMRIKDFNIERALSSVFDTLLLLFFFQQRMLLFCTL